MCHEQPKYAKTIQVPECSQNRKQVCFSPLEIVQFFFDFPSFSHVMYMLHLRKHLMSISRLVILAIDVFGRSSYGMLVSMEPNKRNAILLGVGAILIISAAILLIVLPGKTS